MPDTEDVWAMSPLQQGVYYQSTLDEGASTYLAQNTFDFDRRLDVDAMQRAFTALLQRHPQLRAGFQSLEDALVQVVHSEPDSAISVVDLAAADDATAPAREIAAADRVAPFDIATPPLLRLTVLRLPGDRDRMLFTYHFLLFDGWSRELILRELFALYATEHGVIEPHGDLVVAHLDWLARQDLELSTAAWRDLLAGVTGPTLASGVEPGHPDASPAREPGRLVVRVPAHVTEGLRTRTADLGVTLNAVATAAVSIVTGYHAGTTDVVIGTTVAGRPGELVGIDETIGLFLNTVPVRVNTSPTRRTADVMRTSASSGSR